MAYKKKTSRKYPNKVRRSRKYPGKSLKQYTSVVRGISGFPDSTITRLKWTYITSLSTGSGVYDKIVRGNGPYDPEQIAGGAQPVGYDQYVALYGRVFCYASSVKMTFLPTSNTVAASSIVFGLLPRTNLSAPYVQDMIDQPLAKYKTANALYGAGNNQYVKSFMTTKKVKGLNSIKVQDDDLSSLTTALPVDQWYWHCVVASVDGTTIPAGNVIIEVQYYCKFYQRNVLIDA